MPTVLSCVANSRGRKSPGGYGAVTLFILLRYSIFCDEKSRGKSYVLQSMKSVM